MESCIDHFLNFNLKNPIYIIILGYRQLHLLKKELKVYKLPSLDFLIHKWILKSHKKAPSLRKFNLGTLNQIRSFSI